MIESLHPCQVSVLKDGESITLGYLVELPDEVDVGGVDGLEEVVGVVDGVHEREAARPRVGHRELLEGVDMREPRLVDGHR